MRHIQIYITVLLSSAFILSGCNKAINVEVIDTKTDNLQDETEYTEDKTSIKNTTSLEELEWIQSKLNTAYETMQDKQIDNNKIQLEINDENIELPIVGAQLTKIGLEDTSKDLIINNNESFGNIRTNKLVENNEQSENNNKQIELGYLNNTKYDLEPDNCIIAYLKCDNNIVKLKLDDTTIKVGDNLEEVLNTINTKEISIKYENNSKCLPDILDENTCDENSNNTLYIDYNKENWKIILKSFDVTKSNSDNNIEEIIEYTYTIDGTMEKGVENITIENSILNKEVLSLRYEIINS